MDKNDKAAYKIYDTIVLDTSIKQVESKVYNRFRVFDTSVLPFDVGV